MPIKPSDSTKYLGVKFDNKLNFDKYIISLKQAINKQTSLPTIYTTFIIRPYINTNIATLLKYSQILSRLNYCNSVLTGQNKTIIKRLDAIINRSIRLIYKLKTYDYTISITDLRLRLNWMTTANSTDYKLLTILKKL